MLYMFEEKASLIKNMLLFIGYAVSSPLRCLTERFLMLLFLTWHILTDLASCCLGSLLLSIVTLIGNLYLEVVVSTCIILPKYIKHKPAR